MGRIILPSPHNSYVGTVTTYDMSGGLEGQDKFTLKAASVSIGLGCDERFVRHCTDC
jgi:hypothetical protein